MMRSVVVRRRSLVAAVAVGMVGAAIAPTVGNAASPQRTVATLHAPSAHPSTFLGYSTALSGNTLVVGAPATATGPAGGEGAVYVYTRPAHGSWAHAKLAVLTATTSPSTPESTSDTNPSAGFGASVAISGDTIAVGQPAANDNEGAIAVFAKPASGWRTTSKPTAYLRPAAADDAMNFGSGVAASGNVVVGTAVLGSPATVGVLEFGKPLSGGWSSDTESAALEVSPRYVAYGQNLAVAMTSRLIVLGEEAAEGVWVFAKPPSGWLSMSQTRQLGDPTNGSDVVDDLGTSVAISGSTVFAGAPGDVSYQNDPPGGVYVFPAPGGHWTSSATELEDTTKLKVPGAPLDDYLGTSIAASGHQLAATAPGYPGKGTPVGAVYLFTEPKPGWAHAKETARLPIPHLAPGADYASSVAVHGSTIAVGARRENYYDGTEYVYTPKK